MAKKERTKWGHNRRKQNKGKKRITLNEGKRGEHKMRAQEEDTRGRCKRSPDTRRPHKSRILSNFLPSKLESSAHSSVINHNSALSPSYRSLAGPARCDG